MKNKIDKLLKILQKEKILPPGVTFNSPYFIV